VFLTVLFYIWEGGLSFDVDYYYFVFVVVCFLSLLFSFGGLDLFLGYFNLVSLYGI